MATSRQRSRLWASVMAGALACVLHLLLVASAPELASDRQRLAQVADRVERHEVAYRLQRRQWRWAPVEQYLHAECVALGEYYRLAQERCLAAGCRPSMLSRLHKRLQLPQLHTRHAGPVVHIPLSRMYKQCRQLELGIYRYARGLMVLSQIERDPRASFDKVWAVTAVEAPARPPLALHSLSSNQSLDRVQNVLVQADGLVKDMQNSVQHLMRHVLHRYQQSLAPEQLSQFGMPISLTTCFCSGGTADDAIAMQPGRIWSQPGNGVSNRFIDRWYVMGPVPGNDVLALDMADALPEVDLDRRIVCAGQELSWKYLRTDGCHIRLPRVNPPLRYLAYAEVLVEKAGDYWLGVGHSGQLRMWINNEVVYDSAKAELEWQVATHVEEFALRAGVNHIALSCNVYDEEPAWSLFAFLETYDD